jgi:hypothetical protein
MYLAISAARMRVLATACETLRSQVAAIPNWMKPSTDAAAVINRKKFVARMKLPSSSRARARVRENVR